LSTSRPTRSNRVDFQVGANTGETISANTTDLVATATAASGLAEVSALTTASAGANSFTVRSLDEIDTRRVPAPFGGGIKRIGRVRRARRGPPAGSSARCEAFLRPSALDRTNYVPGRERAQRGRDTRRTRLHGLGQEHLTGGAHRPTFPGCFFPVNRPRIDPWPPTRRNVMPLFMDVHTLEGGVSAKDVAEAHEKDVETQAEYGVDYKNYWVDEKAGKIFCLVEAPDADAAHTVHREAHGLVADEIYEVHQGS
jgi:hypothetical protein